MRLHISKGFTCCGHILLGACFIGGVIGLTGCGGGVTTAPLVQATATPIPTSTASTESALSPATVASLSNLSLDQIAESIERLSRQNPTTSLHDDQFARLLVADLKQQKPDVHTRSYSLQQISPAERRLLITQPWNALRTRDAVNQAFAETAKRYPNAGMLQDRADAFRHTYWNILLCKKVSQSWAEQYTTAHESESSGTDRAMDINNNGVGRRIFRENGFRSEADLSGYAYWFPSKRVSSEGEMNINYEVYLR